MNSKRHIIITLLVVMLAIPFIGNAQMFRGANYWRQFRKEVGGGIGVSNFLGELGGADEIGRDFLYDLEMPATKFSLSAYGRYFVLKNIALKGGIYFGQVSGDDALTQEPFRRNRNLHFRSNITEGSLCGEFHVMNERAGHRYHIRGAHGSKGAAVGVFVYAGLGVFSFTPRAFIEQVGWVNLRDMKSEGQGLEGGALPYGRFAVAIPMGIGFRTSLGGNTRLGLNFGYRKTTTDYIDDVSTNYYDTDAYQQWFGSQTHNGLLSQISPSKAAITIDPNLGIQRNGLNEGWNDSDPSKTRGGLTRGDPTDKDAYMFVQLTLSQKLQKRKKYGKFKKGRYKSRRKTYGKRRRSMPSF